MPSEVFNRLNSRHFKGAIFVMSISDSVWAKGKSEKYRGKSDSDFCHFGDTSSVKTELHWVMAGVLLEAFYGQQLTVFYFH